MLSQVLDIVPPTPPARSGQTRNSSSADQPDSFGSLVDDSSSSEMPQATAPASATDTSSSVTTPAKSSPVPVIKPVTSTSEITLDLIPLVDGDVTAPVTGEDAVDPLAALLKAVDIATNPEKIADDSDTKDQTAEATDTPKTADPSAPATIVTVAAAPVPITDAATETGVPADLLLADGTQATTPVEGAPATETDAAPAVPNADQAATAGDALSDGAVPQMTKPVTDEPPAHGLRNNTDGLEPTDTKPNSSGQPTNPVAALAQTLGPARRAEAQANKTDAAPIATQDTNTETAAAAPELHSTKAPQQVETAPLEIAKTDTDTLPGERPAAPAADPSAARTPAFHVLLQQQDIRHVPGAATTEADAMIRAIPVSGIAIEISNQLRDGSNRFDIRLDPPDLGRIDVRLDVDRSGQVTSRLVVEKSETLDLLRRDAQQLERALQDAGLKTGDNGLQFSLRDQSFAGRDDEQAGNSAKLTITDDEIAPTQTQAAAYGRVLSSGGLDIRV